MNFDWRTYFENQFQDNNSSRISQVGKTIDGNEVSWTQIILIINHLKSSLNLAKTDRVSDLGCGNGLLCEPLSLLVYSITGYDFSSSLIETANIFKKQSNIHYKLADLREINSNLLKNTDIYLLYEVIQHLTLEEFRKFIFNISSSAKLGSRIFIGGVPEKKRIRNFYNTNSKYRYFLESEKKETPHLGSWWSQKELFDIALHSGWNYEFIAQPSKLYTAHYRFDCIFTKIQIDY